MSTVTAPPPSAPAGPAIQTIGAYAKRWWTDVKGGELGSLPIIVGLIVIAAVFGTLQPVFFSERNFVNLLLQMAGLTAISIGIVFVLLIAEIDLSVAFVSGLGGVIVRLPLVLHRLGLGPLVSLLPLLIVTTRGRKSGLPRHSVLEYRRHGSKHYVVSAWGKRTQWFQNLLANPLVTIQKGKEQFGARASVVDDSGEALRVLYLFRKKAPIIYDALLARLSASESVNARTLPDISSQFVIVRLEPVGDEPTPAALPSDLAWTLRVALVGILATTVIWLIRQWRS